MSSSVLIAGLGFAAGPDSGAVGVEVDVDFGGLNAHGLDLGVNVLDDVSLLEANVALEIDGRDRSSDSNSAGLPVFNSEGKESVSDKLSNHVEKLEDQVVGDGIVISASLLGSVGPIFFPTEENSKVVVLHVSRRLQETSANPIVDKGNGLNEDDKERADHPAVKLDGGSPPEDPQHGLVSHAELSHSPQGEHQAPSNDVPVHAEPPGDTPHVIELHEVVGSKDAVNMDTLVLIIVEDYVEGGEATVDDEAHVCGVKSSGSFH